MSGDRCMKGGRARPRCGPGFTRCACRARVSALRVTIPRARDNERFAGAVGPPCSRSYGCPLTGLAARIGSRSGFSVPSITSVNGSGSRGPLRVAYPARVAPGDNIDQAPACFPQCIGRSPRVSARRLHCDRKNFAMPIGREADFALRGMGRADGLLDVGRGRAVISREVREQD